MTNFEKVKELLTIEDMVTNPCKVIHRLRNEDGCAGIRFCEECKQWLEEEYVEPVELTDVERVILQNIDKRYKYIARDKDGETRFFINKPQKRVGDFWDVGDEFIRIKFYNLFNFIKWEDEEPYEITKLLEE